ncbi:hypothetical protein Dgeo_3065 (plasmid) [Deinococcus geothermalis DSM 11300]|uniref:Uncharacterized protein n=1 Tax=Deinococcus geothermalis (strain DSM 11300 / CIP 105573 / AG-3a) TaxID=319795 RepID=A8ZRJ7_DEIGD|nr:hypothetical protein [Deinococcus geothermalis]ABW35106.1 hypothetical protein Dgeo_3065 [Deinococcus geothermalis DSM 11300]
MTLPKTLPAHVTEPCLSLLAHEVRQNLRRAGLPCHSGDGFPLVMLALHEAIVRAAGSPACATRETARALLLTIDAAECLAPGLLGTLLQAEFGHLVTTAGLPLSALALHTPTLRHADTHPLLLHEYVTLATREWTRLPADQDTGGRALVAPLALLVVALARRLADLGADPYAAICALDLDLLLLPERPGA